MSRVPHLRKFAVTQVYGDSSNFILSSQVNYLFQIDLHGNIMFVNTAYEYKFGDKEEYIGQPFSENLHPDDEDKCEQITLRCIQSPREPLPIELRKAQSNGAYSTTYWEFVGLVDEQGKTIGVQGVGHDVGNEKEETLRLEQLSQLNQKLLTTSMQLMEVTSETVHPTVSEALKVIAQFLGFQRGLVYVREQKKDQLEGRLTYEYSSPEVFPLSSDVSQLSIKNFPWWTERASRCESFEISGIKNLPREAHRERWFLNMLNLESVVAIPVVYQQELTGYVLFVSSTQVEPKTDELLESLKSLGVILGKALHHIQLNQPLLDSRSQHKLLTENVADMVSKHDLDGTYNYVSPSCESLTGFKPSELLGTSPFNWIHPDDHAKASEHLEQVLAGECVRYQYRKRRKDGQYYWVEVTAQLVQEGKKQEVVTSIRSVHQQKLTEQANAELLAKSQRLNEKLQESQQKLKLTLARTQELNELLLKSEKKFRSLTEKSFDAIMMYDTQGVITYASPSVASVTGYTAEELVGNYARDYIFPEDLPLVGGIMHNAIANPRERFSSLSRIVRKDGEVIWVESVMTNLLMDESIQGLVSNFRDVTEQQKSEQAIKEYSKRLAIATESANIGIWDWIIPQNHMVWDERTCQMFGVNPKDKADDRIAWKDVVHPDDSKRVQDEKSAALQKRRNYDVEFRIIRQDTHQIRHIKSYAKVTFLEEEPVRMTGVNLDITTLKNAEEQLRKNVTALEKSNAELDQFVYSTSHNLRAPLASVLGLVSLLEGNSNLNEREQYLQLIENSIHRLDETIQEIIDYSRNSRIEISTEPIHFQHIIADVLDGLYFLRSSINIEINLNIADNLVFFSDISRVRMILNNLLSNAIKYFNPYAEQPSVTISVQSHLQGVELIVEDNGIGIPTEIQSKVFDMFFRATTSTNGSGLGLYIVREATHLLGGSISLASKKGVGATFTLYLPSVNKEGLNSDE
ncbi:PAS domain S-box protein [Tunicatimonas pelagia]|uniref:PAS domain S-box protein n=1 Tax=Tunicatimonas pelagia TaxID=931531 RepID=UPI002665B241|nr:PAS domain S-box protein [Tunicatimonas pelagia]WKN44808.1 PAS domain S-box protein [Tunicatimonas pelagia]